jgi:hypothetical protein
VERVHENMELMSKFVLKGAGRRLNDINMDKNYEE